MGLIALSYGARIHRPLKGETMSVRTIAVPARALNYAHDRGFVLMKNGVEWPYDHGPMTVTVPRPRDYAGGGVTLRICFQCSPGTPGDHEFTVGIATYDSGDEFELHGSGKTPLMDLPGVAKVVYATSVVIPPGEWGDGDWWYFRLNRHGMYRLRMLMMSVGIDYEDAPSPLRWRPAPVRKALKKAPKRKAPKMLTKKVSAKARKALAKAWQRKPRKSRPVRP
jgi:hypothetical protein